MEPAITTNDPNIHWEIKTIEVDFCQWGYRATVTTTIRGNCKGLSLVNWLFDQIYEELPRDANNPEWPELKLTDDKGDTCTCTDDEDKYGEWLSARAVAIRIVKIEPYDPMANAEAKEEAS